MRYLLGDSSDAGIEVNYLALLKDVIDCAVVLLEHEGTIASASDRRRGFEKEAAVVLAALGELSQRTTELAEVVATEQGENAIGRCALAIVTATREAVAKETSGVKSALAVDLAKVEQDDLQLRSRSTEIVEKLLRVHELPAADSTIEVTWVGAAVKALARQITPYGVEATVGLEIPAGSALVPDLRVDKLAESAEVSAREVGGWLKKNDKLVPYKIGRYHIVKVTAAGSTVVRLRSTGEATSGGFELVLAPTGDITIESVMGEPVRELAVDPANKPALEAMLTKLDAAVRGLGERRTGPVTLALDGKPFAEAPRAGVLAERLVNAVAPTVHRIMAHSRSPGELVLRRMLGEDRREEIFVPVADLTRRWARLGQAGREVFSPLRLEADPSAPVPEHSGPQRRSMQTSGPTTRPRVPTAGMLPPVPPGARPSGVTPGPPASPSPAALAVAPTGAATLAATGSQPVPAPTTPTAAVPPGAPDLAAQPDVSGEIESADQPDSAEGIPLDEDALSEELDELVDEPTSEARPLETLPSVAEAIARATQSGSVEARQQKLDLLNDPVKYARLSAAIEAALGDIEDDEPPAHS